jgi:hypothetical protein
MPNFIAYIALLSWPIVTIFLIKRKGLEVGILLALLGAHMFLPVAFKIDLPAIPPLNKYSITTATILVYLILNKKRLGFNALHRYMKFVFVMLLVLPFLTALTNSERYSYLPGLTLYDGLSDAITNFLIIIPFLFGVRYFNTYEKQLLLFKYFAIAAFVYAFFTLYEVRMSPRLHWMLYGYFPNSWLQQYREGGFRAIVFMGHGLLVAIFLALGVAAAAAMTRLKEKVLPIKTLYVLIIIFMTLVLQKSLASLIFGAFGLVMIILMSPKRMHQMALLIGVLFLTYPMLSSLNLFPHKTILDVASRVSAERAQSLEFRFDQEKALLNHANSKPLFGWGGWGRNRVLDDLNGSDTSTTDGRWIITLGVSGWIGYLSQFLLIVVPLYLTYRITVKRRIHDKKESILLGAHAILLSVLLLDQMPNSSLNSFYWLVVGSLLGRAYKINQDYLGEKRAESSHNTKLVNSVDNG